MYNKKGPEFRAFFCYMNGMTWLTHAVHQFFQYRVQNGYQ